MTSPIEMNEEETEDIFLLFNAGICVEACFLTHLFLFSSNNEHNWIMFTCFDLPLYPAQLYKILHKTLYSIFLKIHVCVLSLSLCFFSLTLTMKVDHFV